MTLSLEPRNTRRFATAAVAVVATVSLGACAATSDSDDSNDQTQAQSVESSVPTTQPTPTTPESTERSGSDLSLSECERIIEQDISLPPGCDNHFLRGAESDTASTPDPEPTPNSSSDPSSSAGEQLARDATDTYGANRRAAVDAAGDGSRNTSGPEREDFNYNLPVNTPTPGMTVGFDADGATQACTLGFIGEVNGRPVGVTSGHCSDDADSADARLRQSSGDMPARFSQGCFNAANCGDQTLVDYDPSLGADGRIAGRYEISAVVSDPGALPVGTEICKYGRVTGETCGELIGADATTFHAAAFSIKGDSGSPAYIKNDDGTVDLVGMLSGSPRGAGGETNDNVGWFISAQHVIGQLGLDSVVGRL